MPGLEGNVTSTNLGSGMTLYFSAPLVLCGVNTGTRRLLPALIDFGEVAPAGSVVDVDTCSSGALVDVFDTVMWLGQG